MAPKSKNQWTISAMFAWKPPNDTNDININIDLNEDMDLFGTDLESLTQESCSSKTKEKPKRKFRDAWRDKFPWIRCIMQGEKTLMKCTWCEKYASPGPWGVGSGCITLQLDAILTHVNSSGHKLCASKWICDVEGKAMSIPKHVSQLDDINKNKVITTMKLMYFIAKKDLSIATYQELCDLAVLLEVPNMPKQHDYISYTSRYGGYEFLVAFGKYLLEIQSSNLINSPYYSLMLDESTDNGLELHLIVYVTYLQCGGCGPKQTEYMGLLKIPNGKGRTIYEHVKHLLGDRCLNMNKLIGLATDGASSMIGSEIGTVTLMKNDIPNLVGVHCIAHREALVISDVSKDIPELILVEKIANKVYAWANNSTKRTHEILELLEQMQLDAHRPLQIHNIRWLSRGQVMERLVSIMPAILTIWKKENLNEWYNKACIYSVQFCFCMMADVLHLMNILSLKLQKENLDVTSIGAEIDITISNLRRSFLRNDTFADGTMYLSKFLRCSKVGFLEIEDKDGVTYRHELYFKQIPMDKASQNDTNPNIAKSKGMRPFIDGSLESCIKLSQNYVQNVIDGLNARFPDLSLFNAAKLFSPCHYADDDVIRDSKAKTWLGILISHLQPNVDVNACPQILHDAKACEMELYRFVDTLRLNCEGYTMHEAWRMFCKMKDWQDSFPHLMKLWQATLVIPSSTVSCERGFSKQNLIKEIKRNQLNIEHLDDLM